MIINIGYQCGDISDCDKHKECKYRPKSWIYKLHNIDCDIRSFFLYKLHIKLPCLIYIQQKWERLSGTDKCPYHKSRNYTCDDCKYSRSVLDKTCYCDERNSTSYEERITIENEWGKNKCGYFEKNELADYYKNEKY